MSNCPNYNFCTLNVHTKEQCTIVNESYYGVANNKSFICPHCRVIETGPFKAFYEAHSEHIGGFLIAKKKIYRQEIGKNYYY